MSLKFVLQFSSKKCKKRKKKIAATVKWAASLHGVDRWVTGGNGTRQRLQPATWAGPVQAPSVPLTCVACVTKASCLYSELPHPYSCPSLETARLQSPYVLICCTSTPARSPPTSTGLELMLWCPSPGIWDAAVSKCLQKIIKSENLTNKSLYLAATRA